MWSAGKSILLCSWICVLLTFAGCAQIMRFSPLSIAAPSILRVSVSFGDEGSGTCTAFSVQEHPGRWITAGHCAQGPVTLGNLVFRPLEVDSEHDIAMLATEQGLPALPLGPEPVFGDPTTALGHPLTSERVVAVPSVYQGVFKMWKEDTIPFAIFVGNSMPGMSGGPILDRQGRVISVVLGGGNPSTVYQNVGFGVPYQAVRKMVVKWRVSAGDAVASDR